MKLSAALYGRPLMQLNGKEVRHAIIALSAAYIIHAALNIVYRVYDTLMYVHSRCPALKRRLKNS